MIKKHENQTEIFKNMKGFLKTSFSNKITYSKYLRVGIQKSFLFAFKNYNGFTLPKYSVSSMLPFVFHRFENRVV
jgi:hypothetical protein